MRALRQGLRRALAGLRQRLIWRLLTSYLLVVVVGFLVFAGFAELQIPNTLANHTAVMQATAGSNPSLVDSLYQSFSVAFNEVLAIAAGAAILAAVVVSIFTARRIVGPIQAMMRASQSIAAGDYRQRVEVPGDDELTALAVSFNSMAVRLGQTERRRMELIGDVAHELRTPLASIRSMMEGLVDGVIPADEGTFLNVQRETARLQRLASDLEELSRVEAGQMALDLQPVALPQAIESVARRLAPQYEDKSVALRLSIPAALPMVQADPNRLTQVLTNLLGNALQYTPAGGSVEVRAWSHEREVLVSVQDTGIGIAPEHLPHIFERFYRVDKSRSRAGGGSGIGLTIARHLVEAHSGRLWAESAGSGQGSTLTFALPASTALAAGAPASKSLQD